MPKLESGEARNAIQDGGGHVGRLRGRTRTRHRARAMEGLVNDVPVEMGQAAFSMQGGRSHRSLRSIRSSRWSRSPSAMNLRGIRVGETVDIRLVTGQTASWKNPFRIEIVRARRTRTYRIEVEAPNPERRHSGWHNRRGGDSIGPSRRPHRCRARP